MVPGLEGWEVGMLVGYYNFSGYIISTFLLLPDVSYKEGVLL